MICYFLLQSDSLLFIEKKPRIAFSAYHYYPLRGKVQTLYRCAFLFCTSIQSLYNIVGITKTKGAIYSSSKPFFFFCIPLINNLQILVFLQFPNYAKNYIQPVLVIQLLLLILLNYKIRKIWSKTQFQQEIRDTGYKVFVFYCAIGNTL